MTKNLAWRNTPALYEFMRTRRSARLLIAATCGIHPFSVYKWRVIPPHCVKPLAELLGVEPESLLPPLLSSSEPLTITEFSERGWKSGRG
jgi:hypothetical protein